MKEIRSGVVGAFAAAYGLMIDLFVGLLLVTVLMVLMGGTNAAAIAAIVIVIGGEIILRRRKKKKKTQFGDVARGSEVQDHTKEGQ